MGWLPLAGLILLTLHPKAPISHRHTFVPPVPSLGYLSFIPSNQIQILPDLICSAYSTAWILSWGQTSISCQCSMYAVTQVQERVAWLSLGWEGRLEAFQARRAKADSWAAEVTLEESGR